EQACEIFRLFMRSTRVRQIPVTEVLAGLAVAGIIWYGGARVISDPNAAGRLFAFLATVALLSEPFKKLVRTNYTIQQGIAGAERVFGLLDQRPQIVDRPGAVELRGIGQGIDRES